MMLQRRRTRSPRLRSSGFSRSLFYSNSRGAERNNKVVVIKKRTKGERFPSKAHSSAPSPPPSTSNMATICALNVPNLIRSTAARRDVRANAFGSKKVTGVAAAVPRAGQTYANVGAAVDAGLIQGVAPFEDGLDLFGFFNDIDQAEAQRYADVEITHGRLAMLASVGFLVGESVEGSSFLFDANVTGPAINHFQQVPAPFWALLGVSILAVESRRVLIAWQSPFDASRLGLMKDDHTPGDYGGFDPLGLSKNRDEGTFFSFFLSPENPACLVLRSSCTTLLVFHDVL